MAIIEALPVLFMLVLVFNFSMGFFGAIHSGILNSIGSYNYAMETFRFRSSLMYFRPGTMTHYKASNNRVHGITKEGSDKDDKVEKGEWPTTIRAITLNYDQNNAKRNLASALVDDNGGAVAESDHMNYKNRNDSTNIWFTRKENYTPQQGTTIQSARIWIKTVYGICISADCGGI